MKDMKLYTEGHEVMSFSVCLQVKEFVNMEFDGNKVIVIPRVKLFQFDLISN